MTETDFNGLDDGKVAETEPSTSSRSCRTSSRARSGAGSREASLASTSSLGTMTVGGGRSDLA